LLHSTNLLLEWKNNSTTRKLGSFEFLISSLNFFKKTAYFQIINQRHMIEMEAGLPFLIIDSFRDVCRNLKMSSQPRQPKAISYRSRLDQQDQQQRNSAPTVDKSKRGSITCTVPSQQSVVRNIEFANGAKRSSVQDIKHDRAPKFENHRASDPAGMKAGVLQIKKAAMVESWANIEQEEYVPKISIKIPYAEVCKDEFGKEHAVFYVEVTLLEKNPVDGSIVPNVRKIGKKFSDFRHLHEIWTNMYSELGNTYPIPQKVWVGNRSPEVVESRRQALEKYLVSLSQVSCVLGYIADFIGVDAKLLVQEMKEKRDYLNRVQLQKLKNGRKSQQEEEEEVAVEAPKRVSEESRQKIKVVADKEEDVSTKPKTQETVKSQVPIQSQNFRDKVLPNPVPTSSQKRRTMKELHQKEPIVVERVDRVSVDDENGNAIKGAFHFFEVAYDYEPVHNVGTELELKKGEIVAVVPWKDNKHPGWVYGFNEDGVGGYFPANFLKESNDCE
jgi:hypothetical protein